MTGKRGPDYADHLTEQQAGILSQLRSRVEDCVEDRVVAAPPRRPGWLRPLALAAGVMAVLLAAAVSQAILRGDPRQGATEGLVTDRVDLDPADTLTRIATALPTFDPPAENLILRRRQIRIAVIGCAVTAIATTSWSAPAMRDKPVSGRLVVDLIRPPAGLAAVPAAAAPGCSGADIAPRNLFDGQTVDQRAEWTRLHDSWGGVFPGWSNPHWVSELFGLTSAWVSGPAGNNELAARFDKLCPQFSTLDCRALRWTVIVEFLTSPETSQAQRKAALELAIANSAEATSVVGGKADVTGRPGVTLEVPYAIGADSGLAPGATMGTAQLTWDESTGGLLQRSIVDRGANRRDITVFFEASRVAGN